MVDQLEELFTLTGERERERFLGLLSEAVRADSRFWVAATVRIEFLRDFLDTRYADLFSRPVALGALPEAELATVIEEPGALAGLRFAPGLVALIVADTGTSDALPLLAYLLQELYFLVGRGHTATEREYVRLGGVAGALARQADQVVAGLRGADGIEPILAVLLQFVTTDGGEATRRRVRLSTLNQEERRVVDAFVDARLLVTDLANGDAIAQVAHEALFRQWAPLRQEVEARAEQLRQRAELERWAADWEHSGRHSDYLLTGERLKLAQQWLDGLEAVGQASGPVRDLVEHSRRRDLAFLRRVSEGIGRHVLDNAEAYPDLSTLLSLAALAALAECPPTPLAVRALMTALAFNHLRAVLTGHTDAVRNLAWSPDGNRIATASRDGTARIWNPATRATQLIIDRHSDMVEALAWSPDATLLATASRDGTVGVWDTTTGEQRARLHVADDVVRAVAWAPDGRHLAAGARDRIVRIWGTGAYAPVHELHGHTDNILGLAFSPDSTRLASGSHDRTVRVWDVATGNLMVVLEGPEDFVEGVSWHPDGELVAAASGDRTIRIWNTYTGQQTMLIRAHDERAWNVAFSPDGTRLASCGADRIARIWDPANAQETCTLRGHTGDVWGITWSPDGTQVATGSADNTTRIWAITPHGAEETLLTGHLSAVQSVAVLTVRRGNPITDQHQIVSCSDDHTVRIWDPDTGRQIAPLEGHQGPVHGVTAGYGVFSCSADQTIRAWPHTGTSPSWVADHDGVIPDAIALSPDIRIATGGRDRMIRLWNSLDGSRIATLAGHTDWVVGLAWSPTGRMLASTSDDRTVRIWDTLALPAMTVLTGHDNWVDDADWSPDEHFLVTGSADHTARIWNTTTGEVVAVLAGHEGRVNAVAWSPDGTRIATASYDRTVRLWDTRTHQQIGIIGVHRDRLTSIAWTPDSRRVVTGSFDTTVRIWNPDVDLNALQDTARARVFRALNDTERSTHLLPAPDQ